MEDVEKSILVKKGDGMATISLNRPPANSYYREYLELLADKIDEINADPAVKVVLNDSTSEKFFCAGADIKIFSQNTSEQNRQMVVAARRVTAAITGSDKIFIAAIAGHCLGGGLEIAMACDLRLAAEGNYLIGLPEVKLGLMPGNGGAPRLIDLIGQSRAMELLVTGSNISPQQAYDFGLFNRLYPKDTFLRDVEKYVKELALGPAKAMAAIKQYVQQHKGMTLQQSLDFETASVNKLYDTPDAKEGFRAFVEKRNPKFE